MVIFSSSISPLTSAVIFWLRSPLATAVVTWAMFRTCPVRLDAMKFTDSVRSFHVPATLGTSACPPSTPSVPTSRATRVTSSAKTESRSTIRLITSLIWRISPAASTVILRVRSPSAMAVATADTSRSWTVRLPASWFTLSVRSRHTPATSSTRAWPPSLPSVPTSLATRVTSEAKALSWSTIVLMVFFSSSISPFTSAVIFWLRSPLATAVVTWAMSRTWLVSEPAMKFTLSVRSFHVPATFGTSRLAAQHALRAHLARHARHLVGEHGEPVDHGVDDLLDLQDLAARLDGDLARQVAVRDGRGDCGHVPQLDGQVAGQLVHVVRQVPPHARDALHARLAAQLPFRAHLLRHARHLGGERRRAGPPSC